MISFLLIFQEIYKNMLKYKKNQYTLFYNGILYDNPLFSAILCKNGVIHDIGTKKDFDVKNMVNLNGGYIFPGFIDSHLHLLGVGQNIENVNLNGIKSPYETIDIINQTKDNKLWILGRGWDQTLWKEKSFPQKNILDKATKKQPVALRRVDGHALWVNSKAMEISGVDSRTSSPSGGRIIKDENGDPTGVFIDKAMDLILDNIPSPDDFVIKRQLKNAINHLNSLGLTSIHDPGTNPETISALKDKSLRSTLKIYAMLNYKEDELAPFLEKGPFKKNDFLTIRSIKIYLDGALGSRGAAMIKPYHDDPKNYGLILEDIEKLKLDIERFNKLGFQTAIHCIGDRANQIALDIYNKTGNKKHRNRIEHAQIIQKNDISRFSDLGVIPCMQPIHCTSDMGWIKDRLGKERISQAYPWNSLINSGSIIAGGSDAPIESANPLKGIYAAITRKNENKKCSPGWQTQERSSKINAIKMYTEWAAYAAFEEKIKGKIQKGFSADFTILDKNLLKIDPVEILSTNVKMTILNGKVVYSI